MHPPEPEAHITKHTDEQLANGDPVVAWVHTESDEPVVTGLGTGFNSWDHLVIQLNHVITTREPTADIGQHVVDDIADKTITKVSIFTLAATIDGPENS